MKARVGIVGAGPGGLMLARLLQMRGVDVLVFERDASTESRFSGGSLDMAADSGRRAIKAAGLEAVFRQFARPEADAYTISDETGRITFRMPPLRFVARRPEIDRVHLREMLLSSLRPGTVQWGRRFVGVSSVLMMKRVHFSDGTAIDVDLLVGADGARSQVRAFVTDQAPEYSGVTLLQGDIPEPGKKCPAILRWVGGANFFALGHSVGIFVQARSSGALSLYISQRIPKTNGLDGLDLSTRDAASLYAREILQDWHPAFIQAVEAAAPFSIKPLIRTAADQSWAPKPNVTLIGDAAHVMPPFGGQGANMAMLDALILSQSLLVADDDMVAAIAGYEREMFARSGKVQRATAELQETFHAPDAAERLSKTFMGPFAFLAPVIPAAASVLNSLLPLRKRS